jgi:hypothetical protein
LAGASTNGRIELSHSGGSISITTTKPLRKNIFKIGGLVGILENTTVLRSYSGSDMKVNSELESYVGGIIGEADELSEIEKCFSRSNLQGNLKESWEKGIAAGLVATLKGKVINCYYAGKSIIKANYEGGLLGETHDPWEIEHSYWDKEFSGIGGSKAGDKRNTKDMYKETNSKDWNFDTIWKIEDGKDYPRLKISLDKQVL